MRSEVDVTKQPVDPRTSQQRLYKSAEQKSFDFFGKTVEGVVHSDSMAARQSAQG